MRQPAQARPTSEAPDDLKSTHTAYAAQAEIESKLATVGLSLAKLLALRALSDGGESLPLGQLRSLAERTDQMKTFDLTVSRTIHASADDVFDVWLDPKSPGGLWYGVKRVIANPVVDGLFYHLVEHEGRSWAHYGRFIRLDRGRAIEHTWMSEATRGLESVVTITLTPRESGTEVMPRHANLPDDELGRQHKEGWTWYLNMLAERFEEKVGAR